MTINTIPSKQPVFPLSTVLFPGGILPLQIFEQRYLNLVKSCLKNEHGFVIALISEGKEVADTPEIFNTGTYATIIDWQQLENTLLGITVKGMHRVTISDVSPDSQGLLHANTHEIYTNGHNATEIPAAFHKLRDILQQLASHPFITETYGHIDYSSATDVCNRLSELLPITNSQKQELLESPSIPSQIQKLNSIINSLGG